ncbi:MAG: hypothetical protein HQ508_07370 [Candidatus Marinimicrobia bacterium]|nr:hypothetical protein [Candidatus Neomarinimicrobiota bacterium]
MSLVNTLISRFYAFFTVSIYDEEIVRRVILLVNLSLVGASVTFFFGCVATYAGDTELAIMDFLGAVSLILNMVLLRKHHIKSFSIYVGLGIISILFAAIYLDGGTNNNTFVWYYIYPSVATFLIGAKKGVIATLLMTIPIGLGSFFGDKIGMVTDYPVEFELRFLIAFLVVAYLSYLFGKNDEANREAIMNFNHSLENTVKIRTAEIQAKHTMLLAEVRERVQAEEKIALALREKEILFREVHHRTKNNMNVIISLLNLQKREMNVKNVEGVFQLIADRIHAMALVHEQLYQSEDISTINLGNYLNSLIMRIRVSQIRGDEEVKISITADEVLLSLQEAVPLGLALNEIITNIFKHANPKHGPLKLTIHVQQSKSYGIKIIVADNGQGLPEGFNLETASTLGLQLIRLLIEEQLDGKVRVSSERGTVMELSFVPEVIPKQEIIEIKPSPHST